MKNRSQGPADTCAPFWFVIRRDALKWDYLFSGRCSVLAANIAGVSLVAESELSEFRSEYARVFGLNLSAIEESCF